MTFGRQKLAGARAISFSSKIGVLMAVVASALGAVFLFDVFVSVAEQKPAVPKSLSPTFNERFISDSGTELASTDLRNAISSSLSSELDIKLAEAKGELASRLSSEVWPLDIVGERRSSLVAAIPLPRSRPVEAAAFANATAAAQGDNRTLLQKLSDLIPASFAMASAHPDGGLSRSLDLKSLGYDNFAAVYDITARAVYLPNGSRLEAHSGFGPLMDNPEHVSKPNIGATPPGVYDLRFRERLFHGVQAVRMIPVEGSTTFGRAGLLAHSYLLGPNGDSNGCVSIKNYEAFLRAFRNGEIKRLVVVPNLDEAVMASRRSNSPS
jgi:hypothetical protein